jgi:hypothetical protein
MLAFLERKGGEFIIRFGEWYLPSKLDRWWCCLILTLFLWFKIKKRCVLATGIAEGEEAIICKSRGLEISKVTHLISSRSVLLSTTLSIS